VRYFLALRRQLTSLGAVSSRPSGHDNGGARSGDHGDRTNGATDLVRQILSHLSIQGRPQIVCSLRSGAKG
jgi:hypothetical protein